MMLDSDTVIRSPHAATRTRKDGRTTTRIDDPRVSVAMQEKGATLTLFFAPGIAWTGKAAPLEIRLTPPAAGRFEPWRLMPSEPLHLQYARASLAHDRDDVAAAIRALRGISSTRRGLSEDFLRLAARAYADLLDRGEAHPVKALAEAHSVDKSTASRWISAARARGFLPASESEKETKA